MERSQQSMDADTRPMDYDQANDRFTEMSEMDKCLRKLEGQGYLDQYKIEKGKLHDLSNDKKYKPKEVKALNFYRFEGISNPDDMSILYAIETTDGRRGVLIDAYGLYADEAIGKFMQEVEIHKKTTKA